MSVFTYNTETIWDPEITSVATEAIYDDGNQTNVRNKTVITVNGTVQVGQTAGDFDTRVSGLRKTFMEPRRALQVKLDDSAPVPLFDITPPDDYGGPKPLTIDFTEIVGQTFCMVNFKIEVNLKECDNETPGNIASNRYSISTDIDEQFLSTRRINGTMVLRESANENNPDALRRLVTPNIPAGFKRTSMTFLVTTDGMTLEYELVDTEQYRTAPTPATSATGSFSVAMGEGYKWFNSFSITLEGPKNVLKKDLFKAAIKIARTRLKLDQQSEILKTVNLSEELYENRITLQMMTMLGDTVNRGDFTQPGSTKIFDKIPFDESNNAVDKGPYGTALLQAAKQKFFDACMSGSGDNEDVLPTSETQSDSQSGGNALPLNTQIQTGTVTSSKASIVSQAQATKPYLHYEETTEVHQRNGIVALPNSKKSQGADAWQVHDPMVIVIQKGSAVRQAADPVVPAPLIPGLNTREGIVINRTISPVTSRIMPNKRDRAHSVAWVYEILFTKLKFSDAGNFVDAEVGTKFNIPRNPELRTQGTVSSVQTNYNIIPKKPGV